MWCKTPSRKTYRYTWGCFSMMPHPHCVGCIWKAMCALQASSKELEALDHFITWSILLLHVKYHSKTNHEKERNVVLVVKKHKRLGLLTESLPSVVRFVPHWTAHSDLMEFRAEAPRVSAVYQAGKDAKRYRFLS